MKFLETVAVTIPEEKESHMACLSRVVADGTAKAMKYLAASESSPHETVIVVVASQKLAGTDIVESVALLADEKQESRKSRQDLDTEIVVAAYLQTLPAFLVSAEIGASRSDEEQEIVAPSQRRLL
jgi:hypothetical protein